MTQAFKFLDPILITIISISNILLGIIVFLSNRKNKVNQTFLGFVFFVTFWIVSAFISEFSLSDFLKILLSRFTMAGAITAFTFFFSFSFYFPVKKHLNYLFSLFIWIGCFILNLAILFTNFLIKGIEHKPYGFDLIYNSLGFNIFLSFFLLCVAISIFNFIRSYIKINKSQKLQIQYLFLGFILLVFSIIGSNIILPIIINSEAFYRLGSYSVIFFVGFTTYAIVRHELMDIKVVLTEVLVGIIGIILFAQIFVSRSLIEYIARTVFFLIVAFFGYLLVKSVLNEIKRREEMAQMAEKLRKANERLKELDKLKDEFLNITSHELGTPLSGIEGYLSMIIDEGMGKLDKKAVGFVKRAYESSQRMARLIRDLLNVSRIEQKRLVINKKPYNLEKLTEDAVNDLSFSAKEKGIELKYEKPFDSSNTLKASSTQSKPLPKVFIDPDRIREVILNLINNAIKFTEKGTVAVEVKPVQSKSQEVLNGINHSKFKVQSSKFKVEDKKISKPKYIKFSVADTGHGISKEDLAHIFEKFYRGSIKASKSTQGTGLGLYICQGIIELHNGKIWAESELGKGSRFSFILPIMK